MKVSILLILFLIVMSMAGYGWMRLNRTAVYEGKEWTARQFGDRYVVSIRNRAELAEALADFAAQRGITAGAVYGIGAVDRATLRFFNPETKKYVDKTFDGQMEITNLSGNISTKDGKEYLHLHVTLGNSKYQGIAGHLLSAVINGAGEFVVEDFPGARLERTYDPEVGLNFYDFKK